MFNREYTRLFFVFLAVVLFVSQSVYAKRRVRKVDRIGKKVSFTTKDGIVIQGLFKPPKSSSKETINYPGLSLCWMLKPKLLTTGRK